MCGGPVACKEQSIDQLALRTNIATGLVREEGTTQGPFLTFLDARAGGASSLESYTYARFTPTGLVKVDLDDQSALASTAWDIAVRRYNIRVNSGVSGPSCVTVAQTPAGTLFDAVTSVDPASDFLAEAYFTANTCEFVPDDSGINAPGTALATFWSYNSCLVMTNKVFLVRLADGRHVKLQVVSYYEPAAQEQCNTTGTLPATSGAAQFRFKWAYLP
ncbi:HmuY family protein [Corallococcus sp. CA053C]|uniref:HmuY family protein n=1 Tax=Corallococcus sp. CA053C TaxID=2316732 RepID=UPI0018F439D9|nr:HmuY family protein [Corallococcus sp. CA053C]